METAAKTPEPRETKALEDTGRNEWEEHLEELRRRIIAVLVVFFAATSSAFAFSDRIAAFLMAPVAHLGVKLYTFSPPEKFMAYLHLAVWTGMIVTAPFFLLQAGMFVWPALRKGERKYALTALLVAPFLFLGGAVAAYRLFSPMVLGFFLSFASADGVQALWGLREYLGLLSAMMVATGVLLQMPLLLLVLFMTGLVTPGTVARYRPHIILFIFFLAAVCTPPDVVSQVMLGIPLYLLFELTLFVGKLWRRNR